MSSGLLHRTDGEQQDDRAASATSRTPSRPASHLEKNLDHPVGPFGYTISTMHCMTVSLSQGGAGLETMWGEELAEQMLAAAGLTGVHKHKLNHDFINAYFVASRG